jgi:hypothetical protein
VFGIPLKANEKHCYPGTRQRCARRYLQSGGDFIAVFK